MANQLADVETVRARPIGNALVRRLVLMSIPCAFAAMNVWIGVGVLRGTVSPYWFVVAGPVCLIVTVKSFVELAQIVTDGSQVIVIHGYRLRQRHLYQMAPPILARMLGIPTPVAMELHERMNPWITPSWPLTFWCLIAGASGAGIASFVANEGGQPLWIMLILTALALLTLVVCTLRGEP